MSSNKCARCEQTVYPVEGLRCLDKMWHKSCFKCNECGMTLNLKNYKGFEKRPYCNAHCPQAKATTVADTPEIRRLAENTRIQSQAKYHEEFEKSKGKGFTAIADDPETLRIKETSKIISNVAYHGELDRKKQMEEKRGLSGQEDERLPINNNRMSSHTKIQNDVPLKQDAEFASIHQSQSNAAQKHQYQVQRQIQQQQMQQQLQQQQLLHKQQPQLQQIPNQKQHQQMHFAQDHNGQPIIMRQPQVMDPMQQQAVIKQMHHQQQYSVGPHHQKQMIMRQQQHQHQQLQQQQLMLQQHRQASEPTLPVSRQASKQSANHHPQQMMKPQMIPMQSQQHPIKYIMSGDAAIHPVPHLVGPPLQQMVNHPQLGPMANGSRVPPNQAVVAGMQGGQHMIRGGYNQYPIMNLNGAVIPKQQQPPQQQQQQQMINSQQRHLIHPSQIHQVNHPAHARPHHTQQPIPHQQQVPGRVFRAMYDYMANDVDEVSFFENDILVDCVNVDRNWLIGKVSRSGETGMLPANYVAELPSQ